MCPFLWNIGKIAPEIAESCKMGMWVADPCKGAHRRLNTEVANMLAVVLLMVPMIIVTVMTVVSTNR